MASGKTGLGSYLKIGVVPAVLIAAMVILEPADLSLPSLLAAALHECGHLAAATLLGIPLRSLDIGPLGATIRVRGSMISYRDEFLLCAAGPVLNIICACLAYFCIRAFPRPPDAGVWFCAVCVMLAVLNLLPIDGFDGGRMLSCAVAYRAGPRAAARTLSVCSFISVVSLWMFSVYLLMRNGSSVSLFLFTLSIFSRVFLEKEA